MPSLKFKQHTERLKHATWVRGDLLLETHRHVVVCDEGDKFVSSTAFKAYNLLEIKYGVKTER